MSILNRYLLRRNLFLLLVLLSMGACIYILSDLFQRLDVFLDAGRNAAFIALFFLVKLPVIISQILPAVFLLSLVIQFSLMNKNRENIALQSGGVSPTTMLRFALIYGLVWACCQFAFSQVLGVSGEKMAAEMWNEDVKGRNADEFTIKGLFFTQGNYVVHAAKAWPAQERAENVYVYRLSADGLSIEATHTAKRAESSVAGWTLFEVESIYPPTFSYKTYERLPLDIRQDLETFRSFQPKSKNSEIEIGELYSTINRLEQAGTNVEAMRTEFYGRFAYAGSIIAMGILALAISMRTESIYVGVLFSLVCTFLFYAATSFFAAMGETGALRPPVAAWASNFIFSSLGVAYILSHYIKTIRRKI